MAYQLITIGVGYTGVFFLNILDSDELKFFWMCLGIRRKKKNFFLKKVQISGFAVQNRSGKMAILGRIFQFHTLSTQKVFKRCI